MTNLGAIAAQGNRAAAVRTANRWSAGHLPAAHMSAKGKSRAQQRTWPRINITLDGCADAKIATYSTLDRIEGKVSIVCPVDTPIDDLDISFIGKTTTFTERMPTAPATSSRSEAFHQFLKLSQPIAASAWSTGDVFEAGKVYAFDFLFVVPEQLLPRVCRHTVASSNVQQEHIQLPPSLGDDSTHCDRLLDDFAPGMAKISYAVTATLKVPAKVDGTAEDPVVQSRKVRVVPAVDERAPLADGPTSDYQLRAEKDIRKGVFKGKLGRLVVEAAQPRPISLPSHAVEDPETASTHVTVNLRFDPFESNTQTPRLGSLVTKLKINTFFSTTARVRLPTRKDMRWDFNQAMQSDTIALSTRCMAAVEWTFHADDTDSSSSSSSSRRASASSSATLSDPPAPSAKYRRGRGYYTAVIVVPVALPDTKAWVPTFHTCLVSRTYALSLHLGAGPAGSVDARLRLPLQIAARGDPASAARHRASLADDRGAADAAEAATAAAQANPFFAPRIVRLADHAPPPGPPPMVGRAPVEPWELPPGYDEFARAGTRTTVAV